MNICIISDFFYPDYGGVEIHIQNLAMSLLQYKNKVVILTRSKCSLNGLYFMNSSIRIYYVPTMHFIKGTSIPYLSTLHQYLKQIVIHENIEIIHMHQCTSVLGIEAIFTGLLMNIPVVLTEHSLFGKSSIGSCLLNLLMDSYYLFFDAIIFVSNISRANFSNRMKLVGENYSQQFFVIHNGITTSIFNPFNISRQINSSTIYVVSNCRLVDIKGAKILLNLIPKIISQYEDVNFIIIGDGPKKDSFYRMIHDFNLKNRVKMFHNITQHAVSMIYKNSHIYLHTSMNEAFGMSILEAIACSLRVVSTKVGALPDILPKNSAKFVDNVCLSDVYKALCESISEHKLNFNTPLSDYNFEYINHKYSWSNITSNTINVYEICLKNKRSLSDKIYKNIDSGRIYFSLFILIMIFYHFLIENFHAFKLKSLQLMTLVTYKAYEWIVFIFKKYL